MTPRLPLIASCRYIAKGRCFVGAPNLFTQTRASGFLSLPSTRVGKWAARLLLLSLFMMTLNSLVLLPDDSLLELLQSAFNLATFLCVVSSGSTGLFALVARRERSWTVVLSVLLLIGVLAFVLPDIVMHDQGG